MTQTLDPVDKPALLHKEEFTTPDLVELSRQGIDALNRWDPDAMSLFAQSGRMSGAAGRMEDRFAWAMTWERGLIVHVIAGKDIDEAGAAVERLAESRG
jgi:hypothetical protein